MFPYSWRYGDSFLVKSPCFPELLRRWRHAKSDKNTGQLSGALKGSFSANRGAEFLYHFTQTIAACVMTCSFDVATLLGIGKGAFIVCRGLWKYFNSYFHILFTYMDSACCDVFVKSRCS